MKVTIGMNIGDPNIHVFPMLVGGGHMKWVTYVCLFDFWTGYHSEAEQTLINVCNKVN